MTPLRAEIVAEARSWIGTPFHHQARLKGVGCDCAGLVIGVARALELVPPEFDVTGYARQPDGVSLLAACDTHMQRIGREELQPGDVLVMRWDQDPQHMGIVGDYIHGGLSLIHALGVPGDKRSRVVEHRLDMMVMIGGGQFIAAYRLPGVA